MTRGISTPPEAAGAGSTTGVLGGSWRGEVTTWGAVRPWGGQLLDWHVAADDRWHTPSAEAAVRQRRVDGTPLIETRLRIPGGDAVQRIWSVPDAGGLTLIEVVNESPLPIAVAFTRRDLLSTRPPTDVPLEGIDLSPDAVAFPIGHHSSVTVAIAHDGRGAGPLPPDLPPAEQVGRGWLRFSERAGTVELSDVSLGEELVASRSEIALVGPGDPRESVAFLVAVDQLVRLGEDTELWLPDVAGAAEVVIRQVAGRGRRGRWRGTPRTAAPVDVWPAAAALDAAARIVRASGDGIASRDLASARSRLGPLPPDGGDGTSWWDAGARPGLDPVRSALRIATIERRLADADGRLLAAGLPSTWLGGTVEVRGLPVGLGATVSFALRWHGARPAVLWEVDHDSDDDSDHDSDHGDGRDRESVTLTSPVLAPGWSTTQRSGEALWPVPPHAAPASTIAAPAGDVSFG